MRIGALPLWIRRLPNPYERRMAVQEIVNGILDRWGICPVTQYVAGPRAPTVCVCRDRSRHLYLSGACSGYEDLVRRVFRSLQVRFENYERRQR